MLDPDGVMGLRGYSSHNDDTHHAHSGVSIIVLDALVLNVNLVYRDVDDPPHLQYPHPNPGGRIGRMLMVTCEYNSESYHLQNVYAPSDSSDDIKIQFYEHYTQARYTSHVTSQHTVLVGDWNIVEDEARDTIRLDPHNHMSMYRDVTGRHRRVLPALAAFYDAYSVADPIPAAGNDVDGVDDQDKYPMTFVHRNHTFFARLDRYYLSSTLDRRVLIPPRQPATTLSDHQPLLLRIMPTEGASEMRKGHDVVRADTSVMAQTEIRSRVQRLIESEVQKDMAYEQHLVDGWRWSKCLARIKQSALQIYTKAASRQQQKLQKARETYMKVVGPRSQAAIQEKQEARAELHSIEQAELDKLRHRARAYNAGIDEGMNKEFFRRNSVRLQAQTYIKELHSNPSWHPPMPYSTVSWQHNANGVKRSMADFWSGIVDRKQTVPAAQQVVIAALQDEMESRHMAFSPADLALLRGLLTTDEIRATLEAMARGKSPGLDGLPVEFYLIHSNDIDPVGDPEVLLTLLLKVYEEAYAQGSLPPQMLINIVHLLFKKRDPNDRLFQGNYRPITLQNLDYKILYTLLARRLSQVIHKVVFGGQHAYVPGRQISEAILLTRLIAHRARCQGLRHAILFLDMAKAFDSVDHAFTYAMLRASGVPEEFIRWVKMALEGSVMRLIINGYLTEAFPMLGGGKQGDPLYPYLFIIVMNGFEALFLNDNLYQGIEVPGSGGARVKLSLFADDATTYVGGDGDPARALAHARTMKDASGLGPNYAKTDLFLAGEYVNPANRPQGFATLGVNVVTHDTPIRSLGVIVGPLNAPELNARNVLAKMKAFVSAHDPRNLTIAGANLMANVGIVSKGVFLKSNAFYPTSAEQEERVITNHYTSGRTPDIAHRPHIYSYKDKTTPSELGGPLHTLLPTERLQDSLAAKWIYKLANTLCTHTPWAHFLAQEVYGVAAAQGIYTLDHALTSDLRIRSIQSTSPRDPYTQRMLQGWARMGFRRPMAALYEEVAERNLFRNWDIVDGRGDTLCMISPASPFSVVRRRTLYHVAQLFTNYDKDHYIRDPVVPPGVFLSNLELTRRYVKRGENLLDVHWDALKKAVEDSGYAQVCRRGTQPLVSGEYVASWRRGNPSHPSRVYRVQPDGRAQLQILAKTTRGYVLEPSGPVAHWGAQPQGSPFPHSRRCEVRRILTRQMGATVHLLAFPFIHVRREDDANLWRVPGLAPSIVVRDMLGLRLGNYTTHHSATTFRDSARLYRRHGYGFVTPALSALAAHMPHVNLKVVSRALLHSRVSKRVTDFLWRLITGKLFMGEDAFTYLTRRSMVPHLRDKYQFCPYCPVQTRATQQHLIWDCPSLSGYWRLIRQLMSNLQLPRLALAQSVDSVSGLLSFITKESNSNIRSIMEYEVVFLSLYSVFAVYTDTTMKIANSNNGVGDPGEMVTHCNTVVNTVLQRFDQKCHECMLTLPYHIRSVDNMDAFDRALGGRKPISVMYIALQPPPCFDINDLSPSLVGAFSTTWCSNNFYSTLEVTGRQTSLRFKPLLRGLGLGGQDGRPAGGRPRGR